QSRGWLPNPIGGVLWFGVDDTATTTYFPVYCGIKEVPKHWAQGHGSMREFSWDSAFWVTNAVTNWAYSRWSDMIGDVQKVQ
ncbi:dipeptidase, partial [Citrobacter sp. AAK_AS5]